MAKTVIWQKFCHQYGVGKIVKTGQFITMHKGDRFTALKQQISAVLDST